LEVAVRDHDLYLAGYLTGYFEGLDGEPRYEAVRKRDWDQSALGPDSVRNS
jgi:hypothetical protein